MFKILGNNANGIRGKIDSLKNVLNLFFPSCVTIQESKLGKPITIPGYKSYFNDRVDKSGGGLITAAKLGKSIFSKDPHDQTENGSILYDFVQRNNLNILNTDKHCTGSITRHKNTRVKEEKSIIDFVIVCEGLKQHFESMSIDDTRTYTLTKYCTTKGVKTKTQSDHNILFAKFGLKYNT